MNTTAIFSPCRKFRYKLTRVWRDDLQLVTWVMLNPSTADERKDDPTIRRCIGFAMNWGFGGIEVYNIFSLRSPNPMVLRKVEDPIGPENDDYLVAIDTDRLVVAAWGNDGQYRNRSRSVKALLANHQVYCLGKSKNTGEPKHPLYLRATTERILL